jgi:hypothetical protein
MDAELKRFARKRSRLNFKVSLLSQNLPRVTDENHESLQSG